MMNDRNLKRLICLAALLCLGAIGACEARKRVPILFHPVEFSGKMPKAKEIVESIPVRVDVKAILSDKNGQIRIEFPGRRFLTLTKARQEHIGKRGIVWMGTVANEPFSVAAFAVVGRTIAGHIHTSRRVYRLHGVNPDIYLLSVVDQSQFAPELDPIELPSGTPRLLSLTCPQGMVPDTGSQVDVLVAYTQAARDSSGGVDGIEAQVYLSVALTNESYIRSDLNHGLHLVNVSQVPYQEVHIACDLANLSGNNSGSSPPCQPGQFDPAVASHFRLLRSSYGADAVVLMTDNDTDPCGYSYQYNANADYALSVVNRTCAVDFYSFGHELGHLMGARHAWSNHSAAQQASLPRPGIAYNYAYIPTPNPNAWMTIMAFNNQDCLALPNGCERLLNWSNPMKMNGAEAMGVLNESDNARTLNDNASTVARYCASSAGLADVWMKDTWNDVGQEPNTENGPMWKSPYLWVRMEQDTEQIHLHEHQNPSANQQNYVYVKIQNGLDTAAAGELQVYAAEASTGLAWPTDWQIIGTRMLDLTQKSATIVEVPWTPTSGGHYCLLARWVGTAPPLGPKGETGDINANTRSNNKIIWRNVNVMQLASTATAAAWFRVRNPESRDEAFAISITPPIEEVDMPFLKIGRVVVKLDDILLSAWAKNGYQGRGFERDGNVVTISDPEGAILEALTLGPRSGGTVDIGFKRLRDETYARNKFSVDIAQTTFGDAAAPRVIGGVTYEINVGGLER